MSDHNVFDFDRMPDRTDTRSIKWDFMHRGDGERPGPTTLFSSGQALPMWVADMDFPAPPPVVEALQRRVDHGVLGYSYVSEGYREAVVEWYEQRHGWQIQPSWLLVTHGVVQALCLLVRAFAEGERVALFSPVYYPFYRAITLNGAEVVRVPLRYSEDEHRYHFDLDLFSRTIQQQPVKLLFLCNPHNPVGRVWSADTLNELGNICLENGIIVVADEIHGDLTFPPHAFTPFASLDPRFAENTITCTAASKTFNLAGLATSNILISDPRKRARFKEILNACAVFGPNLLGAVATEVAYREGGGWLDALLSYLQKNRDLVYDRCQGIDRLRANKPEGTYLSWLDFRAFGLEPRALTEWLRQEAGVCFDSGRLFGPDGAGFERLNFATPRPLLVKALDGLDAVCRDAPR